MDCGRSALNTYHSSHVRHRTRSGGKRHNCPQCWTGSPHARHPAIYSAHVKCRQSCCGLARVGGCRGDVGMGMGRRDHTPFHPPSRDKNPYPPATPRVSHSSGHRLSVAGHVTLPRRIDWAVTPPFLARLCPSVGVASVVLSARRRGV